MKKDSSKNRPARLFRITLGKPEGALKSSEDDGPERSERSRNLDLLGGF